MMKGTACTGSKGVACELVGLNIGASTMGFGGRLGMGGEGGCKLEQLGGRLRNRGNSLRLLKWRGEGEDSC